jgi:hypothetical protein
MTVRNLISPRRVPRALFHTREQVAYTPNYYLVMSRATQVSAIAPATRQPIEDLIEDVAIALGQVTITFSVPIVVNAAVRCADVYLIEPDNDGEWPSDTRSRVRVLLVDPGEDETTDTIVLTVEEMVQGAHYDLSILEWSLA